MKRIFSFILIVFTVCILASCGTKLELKGSVDQGDMDFNPKSSVGYVGDVMPFFEKYSPELADFSYINDDLLETQIEVEAGYDYYVSSVNKANVISTPTTMKKELTYKEVEELISSLPLNITLSDEKTVEAILEA